MTEVKFKNEELVLLDAFIRDAAAFYRRVAKRKTDKLHVDHINNLADKADFYRKRVRKARGFQKKDLLA